MQVASEMNEINEQPNMRLKSQLETVFLRALNESVTIDKLQAITEGAGAQTWKLTLGTGSEYIARIAHAGEIFSQALSKTQEAQVQKAAFDNHAPVADVLIIFLPEDGLGEGYIMPCLYGETRPKRLLNDKKYAAARTVLTTQCAQAMAKIHAIDVNTCSLPIRSSKENIETLYQEFLSYQEPLPVFHLAFRYLQQHLPNNETLTIVHGDFRNGNLMVDEQGLVAVLDWELAHIGNPLEDLGWFCVSSWRFSSVHNPAGGFGSYQELIAAYCQASGRRLDVKTIKFWELLGVLRWGVLCLYQTHVHLTGAERSIERAAIGRRVSECEIDMLQLLKDLMNSG